MEWASSKYRTLSNTAIGISSSLGCILFGCVAMYEHDFRKLLRFFYIPGLFAFLYFWLVPESIRWLLVTGRLDRGIKTLKQIAKWNRRELSNKTITSIQMKYSKNAIQEADSIASDSNAVEKKPVFQLLWTILKTKTLTLRFANCCYQWAASSFIFYGLSQSSTQIAGANRYISFIIVMAIEIPGKLLAQLLLNRFKRKVILFVAFMTAAISVFAASLTEYSWAVLLCFVLGKGAISTAFASMYVYTTELWPTSIRLTIINSCSMFARCGSMIAPFVVILVNIFLPQSNICSSREKSIL